MALTTPASPGRARGGARYGGAVRTSNIDLLLASVIAIGLPLAARWLLDLSGGALAGLALYYGVCCVLVVLWRKGTLDYRRPARWPWRLFAISLLIPAIKVALAWGQPHAAAPLLGVLLTALIWAPLNAAMEQLSWLYVLDAWRNRWERGWPRWLGLAVGIVLLLTLVSLIHLLFWLRFLPQDQPGPWSWVDIPLNILLTASYALLYYQSESLWPTFVIHLLVDLQLVVMAGYAIGPSL